jgi:hypothetical protein
MVGLFLWTHLRITTNKSDYRSDLCLLGSAEG